MVIRRPRCGGVLPVHRLSSCGLLVNLNYTGYPARWSKAALDMADKRPPLNPTSKDEYVISRLRQVLLRHKETSTWRQMKKAIRDANGGEGNATIDRRTLPLICSTNDFAQVRLSLAQLIALDKYFVNSGEGPLFDHRVDFWSI